MKQFYSICLLFIFVANTIAGIGILCYHRISMQHLINSIKKEHCTACLTRLTFSKAEHDKIEWFKKGREFRLHGDMYDIVNTDHLRDGGIVYHCIKDKKEKELYATAEKNFNHSKTGQHQSSLVLRYLNFLSTLFFQETTQADTDLVYGLYRNFFYSNHYHSISRSIPCEPPDFALYFII
jgi:hypothetical protein